MSNPLEMSKFENAHFPPDWLSQLFVFPVDFPQIKSKQSTEHIRNMASMRSSSSLSFTWEWHGDDNRWHAYSAAVASSIELASLSKDALSLRLGPWDYVIDPVALTQVRHLTYNQWPFSLIFVLH